VGLVGSADQGVVVAVSTAQGIHLNQGAVVRDAGGMGQIPGAGMTGLAVARGTLTNRAADPDTGGAIMTAGTGVMGFACGAHQGVVVTVRTAGGAGDGDDTAVNRGVEVQGTPAAGMTGGTVADGRQVLTAGDAAQAAVSIVTAGTAVMGLGGTADQGVVVTAVTAACAHLHQVAVVRGDDGVGRFPAVGMTVDTISATDRNPGQNRRNRGCVTQIAVAHVGDRHGRVRRNTRIVTAQAGRGATNITRGHMIKGQVNHKVLVGVTGQTVGRIGTGGDGVDDFLTWT